MPEAMLVVESTSIGRGQSGAVVVRVEDVSGLYGADVQLRFDASRLQAIDADEDGEGVQLVLGDFLSPDFVIRNVVDNEAGTLHFALSQINPSRAKSGSGVLFVLRLQAGDTLGPTALELGDATLGARGGERIPYRSRIGSVTIVAADQAQATPTMGPTPVATAPIAPAMTSAATAARSTAPSRTQDEDSGPEDRTAADDGGPPPAEGGSDGQVSPRDTRSTPRSVVTIPAPGHSDEARPGTLDGGDTEPGGTVATSEAVDGSDASPALAPKGTTVAPTVAADAAPNAAYESGSTDGVEQVSDSGAFRWIVLAILVVAAGVIFGWRR